MDCWRFENVVAVAKKASMLDCTNVEVGRIVNVVKMVARACSRGNELFSSGKFSESCSTYEEGLKYDNSKYVLYSNRAISEGTEIMHKMLDSIIFQRENCQEIKQHFLESLQLDMKIVEKMENKINN